MTIAASDGCRKGAQNNPVRSLHFTRSDLVPRHALEWRMLHSEDYMRHLPLPATPTTVHDKADPPASITRREC